MNDACPPTHAPRSTAVWFPLPSTSFDHCWTRSSSPIKSTTAYVSTSGLLEMFFYHSNYTRDLYQDSPRSDRAKAPSKVESSRAEHRHAVTHTVHKTTLSTFLPSRYNYTQRGGRGLTDAAGCQHHVEAEPSSGGKSSIKTHQQHLI